MYNIKYSYLPRVELPENMALKVAATKGSIGSKLKEQDIISVEEIQSQIYNWVNGDVYFLYKAVCEFVETSQVNLSRYEGEDRDELMWLLKSVDDFTRVVLGNIEAVQDAHFHLGRFIEKFKEEHNNLLKMFLQGESAAIMKEKLDAMTTLTSYTFKYSHSLYGRMSVAHNKFNDISLRKTAV